MQGSFTSKLRASFSWQARTASFLARNRSFLAGTGGGSSDDVGDVNKINTACTTVQQNGGGGGTGGGVTLFSETVKKACAEAAKRILPVSVLARQMEPAFYIHDAKITPEIIKAAKDMWNLVINNTAPEYVKIKDLDTFEHKSCLCKCTNVDASSQVMFTKTNAELFVY
jgi:hypothetical protein